jgi:hypothetical protein
VIIIMNCVYNTARLVVASECFSGLVHCSAYSVEERSLLLMIPFICWESLWRAFYALETINQIIKYRAQHFFYYQ